MISLVICSINPLLLENIKKNISRTIGIEHEFIVHDNRGTNFGICKVYNQCALKAKYPYLCFVHEDVKFDTDNWGKTIINFIKRNENCGVIGIAGGKYVPRNFISWGDNPDYDRWNFWSYSKHKNEYIHEYYNPENEEFSRVVTLDGVFLVTKKDVWDRTKFDEKIFSGFHLYDADFTVHTAQHYFNYVCHSIKLMHKSSGDGRSKDYYDNLRIFHRKWKRSLPLFTSDITITKKYKIKKDIINIIYLFGLFKTHYGILHTVIHFIRLNTVALCIIMLLNVLVKILKKCRKHVNGKVDAK